MGGRGLEREKEIRDGKVALNLQVQIILVKLRLCKFQTGIEQLLPSHASPYLKHPCYFWLEPVFCQRNTSLKEQGYFR